MSKGHIEVKKPIHPLVSQTLTEALDQLAEEMPRVSVDYIHGDEEFHEHTKSHSCLGFIMEPMQKNELFDNVIQYGVLPKKSFSLGLAEEKRYYFECRLLVEADDDKPETEEDEQPEKTGLPDSPIDMAQPDDLADESSDEQDLGEEEQNSRASRKPRRSLFGRKRD
jgi:hypothetical protein